MRNVLAAAAFVAILSGMIFAADKPAEELSQMQKVSYLIGYDMGKNFSQNEIKIDMDLLTKGVNDASSGKDSMFSKEEMQKIMMAFQQEMMAKQKVLMEKRKKEMEIQGEKNKEQGDKFLAENKKKPGVKTTPSGLQYIVINEGKGDSPTDDDIVVVDYVGTLIDGTKFDSSYDRGQPATFPVKGVIKGWTEALKMMKPGSKYKLFIPSELAYGERGAGNDIGPNAVLIFDVELKEIKNDEPKPTVKPKESKDLGWE
jgi:FKBP-type peptidyl-prolyl cis-trans isomerase FklB